MGKEVTQISKDIALKSLGYFKMSFVVALSNIASRRVSGHSDWLSVAVELALFMLRPKMDLLPSIYHNNSPSPRSDPVPVPFTCQIIFCDSNSLVLRSIHKQH